MHVLGRGQKRIHKILNWLILKRPLNCHMALVFVKLNKKKQGFFIVYDGRKKIS